MNKENICKNCKHFHEMQSSDIVFIERVEVCDELDIEWPCEFDHCENFEYRDQENKIEN